jgi:hypothetical protein
MFLLVEADGCKGPSQIGLQIIIINWLLYANFQ